MDERLVSSERYRPFFIKLSYRMQGINKIRLYLCINFNFTDYEKSTIVIIEVI